MGHRSGNQNQRRSVEEHTELFFHIVDQGYDNIPRGDQQIFNTLRVAVLQELGETDEELCKYQKEILQKNPILNEVIPYVSKKCRTDHVIRLKNKSYLKRTEYPKDPETLAKMFIDYFNNEDMFTKYGLTQDGSHNFAYRIRTDPKFEEVRTILDNMSIDYKEHKPRSGAAQLTTSQSDKLQNKKLLFEETTETIHNLSSSTSSLTSTTTSSNVSACDFIKQRIAEEKAHIARLNAERIEHETTLRVLMSLKLDLVD